ncbi:MAG: EamA family transporter, partial [Chloroflexi bacterium]|nr:EamA family transporter [Chloroflexota bacterium]
GLIALAGLVVIFSDQLTTDVPPIRVAAIIAAAIAGAGTGVLVKGFPRTNPVATNAVGAAAGAPLLLIASGLAGEPWAIPQLTPTWLAFGYLVLTSVIGFVLLVWVILRWTPSAAAYGAVLGPIVTIVLATLLAGEVFGPGFFIGAAIVGAGVYVGALAARPRVPPTPVAAAAD